MEHFTEIQPSDLSIYYILIVISLLLAVISLINTMKAHLHTYTDEYPLTVTVEKIDFSCAITAFAAILLMLASFCIEKFGTFEKTVLIFYATLFISQVILLIKTKKRIKEIEKQLDGD